MEKEKITPNEGEVKTAEEAQADIDNIVEVEEEYMVEATDENEAGDKEEGKSEDDSDEEEAKAEEEYETEAKESGVTEY